MTEMRRRYVELRLSGTPHDNAVAVLSHQTGLDPLTIRRVLNRAERDEQAEEAVAA